MALKITLKPGEIVYIGTNKLIVKCDSITDIYLEGDIPVMREKHFLPPEMATTEARRIYLTLQTAHLTNTFGAHRDQYIWQVRLFLEARPDAAQWIADINAFLNEGNFFQALKVARQYDQFDNAAVAASETTPTQSRIAVPA